MTKNVGTKEEITITYVVDSGSGELSQVIKSVETDKSGKRKTLYYFYSANHLVAQEEYVNEQVSTNDEPSMKAVQDTYLLYHFNNVGSTTAVTDERGAIKYQYQYSPYGELIAGTYGQVAFLYNGKYGVASDDNGLYYMRTRYYNINIKRFINQDVVIGSIERSGSLNRYAYVEGNPISYIDPFGLDKQDSDENKETWERLESGFLYQSSEGHFRLKTELALLSRTVCLEVATEILMKGFIKDMNVIEVAAEIFAHAYLWYQTIFKDGIKDVPELEKVYKFLQKFDVVDLDDGGDARLGANEAYLALWFSALRVF